MTGGFGLLAAENRAVAARRELFAQCVYLQKLLGIVWVEEFKRKQELSAAEIDRQLSDKLEPFRPAFSRAFAHTSRVVEAGPDGLTYEEMLTTWQEAERAMDRVLEGVRVRRPTARTNAERSRKANAKRHEANCYDKALLRDWFTKWRADNPDAAITKAAAAAMETRQTLLGYETVYRTLLKINAGM